VTLPPGLALRPVRLDDVEAIAAYHHQCWLQGYAGLVPQEVLDALVVEDRIQLWREHLASGAGRTAVVAADDRPIAHVGVELDTIESVYVDPAWWGQRIGPVLLAEGERLLQEDGVTDGVLWTVVGNDRAVKVYEAAGWALDGTVEVHDHPLGFNLTEQRMVKRLR
jgi:RimJ/RimL family protein N-acetyltransferase